MITSPALRLFRNSEFIRYQKNAIKLCKKYNPDVLKINEQVNALIASTDEMDELFKLERSNATTGKLTDLDNRRDRAIVGIRTVTQGYALHYDPTIASAAKVVLAGIDKYGTRISRFNYMAETQVLEMLAEDCTTNADMAAAVKALGLQDWVTELNEANSQFDDNYVDRTAEYGDRPETNLGKLRITATEKYESLVAHISSHATLNKDVEAYKKIVNGLNSLTDLYTKMVNSRGIEEGPDTGTTDIENDPALQGAEL
jgi:Family of unknown function (DUF6261)